jgi:putative ABC transport system ATP-binding protein
MMWADAVTGSTSNSRSRIRFIMSETKHTTMIAARKLSKRVETAAGPLDILTDIDLEVRAGEAVAIVGVSGSGKSTLLGLLAGLDLPSAGEIFLSRYRLNDLDEDGRARVRGEMVGFVFQSFQLLPGLTALENVMLPLELIGARDPREQAVALLSDVGLAARLQVCRRADRQPRQCYR